jgi:hypothetical protein
MSSLLDEREFSHANSTFKRICWVSKRGVWVQAGKQALLPLETGSSLRHFDRAPSKIHLRPTFADTCQKQSWSRSRRGTFAFRLQARLPAHWLHRWKVGCSNITSQWCFFFSFRSSHPLEKCSCTWTCRFNCSTSLTRALSLAQCRAKQEVARLCLFSMIPFR